MQPPKFPRFRYSLFKLITHLLIPFATIPVGILFYYASTATLPDKDIHIIFRDLSSISAPFATAIMIAPIYYFHCLFNRSDMSIKRQVFAHTFSGLLNIIFIYYLCYRTEEQHASWESPNGGLNAFFLFTIPQIVCTHLFHFIWVRKYRKPLFLKLFTKKSKEPNATEIQPTPPTPASPPPPVNDHLFNSEKSSPPTKTEPAPPMTRQESQRIFNEQLEKSALEAENSIIPFENSPLTLDLKNWLNSDKITFPPSFLGKKVWETVVFKQNIDEIGWHTANDRPCLIARYASQTFHLVDIETGTVIEKIEPNFNETWDNEKKVFIELAEESINLCKSNPVFQQAYWHFVNNKYIHSSFDPFAHYQDQNGNTRLRKTAYFKSIISKDKSCIAYINKGEKHAFIEIYSMTDHLHIQSINTEVPANHDCKFINNNSQIIVGSDDGIIRIFDIDGGQLTHQLEGHTDSVFSIDVNPSETEFISGSADGVWKIWSLADGDGFGECIHTSQQLKTKLDAPIAIYHTQFSPDGIFVFVITDIGRIMIFLRESLSLQTNLYDKYQRYMQSSKEPNILSLLIDSEEKCFYVGYANGKMQKWA
jgi:hypothetical protein